MFLSFIRGFRPFGKTPARKKRRQAARRRPLSIESFEARQLMAGDTYVPAAPATGTTLTAQVSTTQTADSNANLYSPPHGAAIEGQEWTLHAGFNSTFNGQRLPKEAFRAEIYWYYGKPADAQASGKLMEAGEIKELQPGALEVTGKHTYTDDGKYQLKVLIFVKNHPLYSTNPWKYETPPLTVWEAPVSAKTYTLTGQKGVPLRGVVAEFTTDDPTPKAGEFVASGSVAPGGWENVKWTPHVSGNRISMEFEGTPLAAAEYSLTVNLNKADKDGKLVQALGTVHPNVLVRNPDLMVTKAEWSATSPNVVKVTVQSQGFNGYANVRIYQSTDDRLDGSDTAALTGPTVKLAAGETKTVEVELKLAVNDSPFARSFNCFAVVDPDNRIVEDNETNNWQLFRINQAGVPLTWPDRYRDFAGRQLLPRGSFSDPNGWMTGAIAVVKGTEQWGMGQNCYDFALPGGEASKQRYANLAKSSGTTAPTAIGDIGLVWDRNGVLQHAFIVVGKTANGWLYAQRNNISPVYITFSGNDQQFSKQNGETVRFVRPQ